VTVPHDPAPYAAPEAPAADAPCAAPEPVVGPPPETDPVARPLPPLRILCDDGPLLAVDKPAGFPVQGVPAGIPTLEAQVRAYLKDRFAKPGNVYLGIPHRLDRPVSGAIVFARNSKAAARLAEQFEKRQVRKTSWAIAERAPVPAAGTLLDFVRKVPDTSRGEIALRGAPGAKEARLEYRILAELPDLGTLLEIVPHTGRMHQIRIQLAARGWPVLGDVPYGAERSFGPPPSDEPREAPIALHARRLELLHPIRYEPVVVTAPLPETWTRLGVAEPTDGDA
jgi:23S rRNA pseudouridine1911/1915/1917 synthase